MRALFVVVVVVAVVFNSRGEGKLMELDAVQFVVIAWCMQYSRADIVMQIELFVSSDFECRIATGLEE